MECGRFGPPQRGQGEAMKKSQIVLNQQKAAHLGVQVHPVSEDANADTAAMLQDLYRHI
jgi:hypothetical protein